jgi:type I site-specific restriction endonuclease
MIVNGAGGTGKTFTIFAITKFLKKKVRDLLKLPKLRF